MKSKISLFILFLSLCGLFACESPERREPRSVGATSEILVVTQNQSQWDGPQGEAVRDYFGQFQYGLPQEEPLYKLVHITLDKLSDMFKKHRNIIIIENDNKLKEAVVETRNNLWSKPQRVIKINAPETALWLAAFEENKEGFRILFDRAERERLMNIFRPTAKASLAEELYAHMGIKMLIPEGFFIAKKADGFIWIRNETADQSQAIMAWHTPYRDTADLSTSRLVFVRDSIVAAHIPGPSPGTFMSTDKQFIPPIAWRTDQFVTDFAVEMRGMWLVIGDFMGGPFLSYTIVNPKTGNLLTVEGYVYAPNKNKRDLLRQMEALLYTLNLEVDDKISAP
jgi:hypothetical protein